MAPNFERKVTTFAPHKALKSIACGKLTFDERVVLHRVVEFNEEESKNNYFAEM